MHVLAPQVISHYLRLQRSIVLSESITAGGVASAIASCSGASKVLWASFVVYQPCAKTCILAVEPTLVQEETIVSAQTVLAMAAASAKLYATCQPNQQFTSLALSGFADGKQAGLVFCAVQTEQSKCVYAWHLQGSRNEIQQKVVELALQALLSVK